MANCNHKTCQGPECRRPKKPGIKKMSAKRAKQNTLYNQLAYAFKKLYPLCQAKTPYCTQLTQDVHHVAGRVGSLLTDERYFLAVCRKCHQYIHDNPDTSMKKGWMQSRLKDALDSYLNSET